MLRLPTIILLNWLVIILATTGVQAGSRETDPDGCMTCHGMEGLAYIDDNGVVRDATISADHYAASIHGSVPCSDCHREIRDYPHEVENGQVDCGASCHIDEPSKGEPYTHEAIVKEFAESVHGEGRAAGLTGANRIDENRNDKPPSCRRCHSNTLYIAEDKLPLFKEAFDHEDAACGNCHQGKVWQGHMVGHIFRRWLGARWSEQEEVAVCSGCHADREAMARVKRTESTSGSTKPTDAHFVNAAATYAMSLHGRLVAVGDDNGVSCNDCHAAFNHRHGVLPAEHPQSTVNAQNLEQTCGEEGCHGYVKHRLNSGFLQTDLHDLDWLRLSGSANAIAPRHWTSPWIQALLLLVALFTVHMLVRAYRQLMPLGEADESIPLGRRRFEKRVLRKRTKESSKKSTRDSEQRLDKETSK